MRYIAHQFFLICFIGFVSISAVAETLSKARTIRTTVSMAVANHPESLAKLSEFLEQKQIIEQVESAALPQVSLGVGLGREDSNNASTRANDSSAMMRRESSLSLSQMLFDGYKTHWQLESEQDTQVAIEHELAYVGGQVAIRAIESHLNVARSNQVLNINIDNLQTHEKIASDIQARAKSGKDNWAKVSQINARLSLSLANVEAAKNEVLNANADYLQVVGERPSRDLYFKVEYLKLPKSLTELLDQINQSNPLLLSRALDERAALSATKAANNTELPSLFLESGASWNDNLDGVRGRNSDAFVMFRMRYDIYSGGAKSAAKKQAILSSKRAAYDLDEARRLIHKEAEHAWYNYQSNAKRVRFLADYLESALLTKNAYDKQFDIGQRSLIDLLDAENEVLRANRLLVDAERDFYLSRYQILNLNGDLLKELVVSLPSTIANQ